MTRLEIYEALNKTAIGLGLTHFIEVEDETFVPSNISTLSALIFQLDYPRDKYTDLIKEQGLNIIKKGQLIFD